MSDRDKKRRLVLMEDGHCLYSPQTRSHERSLDSLMLRVALHCSESPRHTRLAAPLVNTPWIEEQSTSPMWQGEERRAKRINSYRSTMVLRRQTEQQQHPPKGLSFGSAPHPVSWMVVVSLSPEPRRSVLACSFADGHSGDWAIVIAERRPTAKPKGPLIYSLHRIDYVANGK